MSFYSKDSLDPRFFVKATTGNEDQNSITSAQRLVMSDLVGSVDSQGSVEQRTSSNTVISEVPEFNKLQPMVSQSIYSKDSLESSSVQNVTPNRPASLKEAMGPFPSSNDSYKSISTHSHQSVGASVRTDPPMQSSLTLQLETELQKAPISPVAASEASNRPLSPVHKLIQSANNSLHSSHRSVDMNTIAQFSHFQSEEKLDYKRELTKLLNKSKGTAYEHSLKRFVEKKLKEIDRDQVEARSNLLNRLTGLQSQAAAVHGNQTAHDAEEGGPLSLMSLTTSKYDSPKKKSSGGAAFSPNRSATAAPSLTYDFLNTSYDSFQQLSVDSRERSRQRLEEMAQPLERNRYKGPQDPLARVTTNHLGRQRPPPRGAPSASPSPARFFSPTRAHHHSQRYLHSHTRAAGGGGLEDEDSLLDNESQVSSPRHKVSLRDFRHWLQKNKEWEMKHKQKVQSTKTFIDQQIQQQRIPQLLSKSVKLTEIAQLKESQQLRQMNQILRDQQLTEATIALIQQQQQEEGEGGEGGMAKKTRLLTPAEVLQYRAEMEAKAAQEEGEEGGVLDVYDRLAIRGRIFSEKKRNLTAQQAAARRTESFSPVILERSVKLAERRKSRLLMSSASIDNGSILLGGDGGGGSVGNSLGQQPQQQQQQRRSQSASKAGATPLFDYDQLPYRKESPQVQRDRKRVVNSRRHYLEQKERLLLSSPSISQPPSRPQSQPSSPKASTSSFPPHHHQQQFTEQENLPHSANISVSTPLPPSSSSSHPPRASASPARSASPALNRTSVRSSSNQSVRTINLTEAVRYDLEKTKSKVKQRQEKLYQAKVKQQYGRAKISTVKPFQPTIIATETQKIMSTKVNSSFEERNIKAIENQLIRKVIASRSPSPGPGHYQGPSMVNNMTNTLSSASLQRVRASSSSSGAMTRTMTTADTAELKCASPGKRGFSFGKAPLASDLGSFDAQGKLITTVYEFKPPNLSPSQRNSGVYAHLERPVAVIAGGGSDSLGNSSPGLQRVNSGIQSLSK